MCCLALSGALLFSPQPAEPVFPVAMTTYTPTRTVDATMPAVLVTRTVKPTTGGKAVTKPRYVPPVKPPTPGQLAPADGAKVPLTVDLEWGAVSDKHGGPTPSSSSSSSGAAPDGRR